MSGPKLQKQNDKSNLPTNSDEINQVRIKVQNFHTILNSQPPHQNVAINKFANNSKYLPISFLEMKMDEMFFGLWQTENFKTNVIANEITGSLELSYFHPVAMVWLKRIGAGGTMIQFTSVKNGGSGDITNIKDKIANTLTKDFPHLKAECFRNACLSIGKSFGRDLNREHEAEYAPIIKGSLETKIYELKKRITDGLDIYQGEDKEELQHMCANKVRMNEFDESFAESIAKSIGMEL